MNKLQEEVLKELGMGYPLIEKKGDTTIHHQRPINDVVKAIQLTEQKVMLEKKGYRCAICEKGVVALCDRCVIESQENVRKKVAEEIFKGLELIWYSHGEEGTFNFDNIEKVWTRYRELKSKYLKETED